MGKNPLIWTSYNNKENLKTKKGPMDKMMCLTAYKKYLFEKNYLNYQKYYLKIRKV